jgi:flagellar motor component MotA
MFGGNIMNQETLNVLIATAGVPLAGAISGYLIAFIRSKTAAIRIENKYKTIDKLIVTAEKAVTDSVIAIQQSFVESLKKEGKFSLEDQKRAFDEAKEKVLKNLTAEGRNAITQLYQDLDTWIENKIEKNVNQLKSESKSFLYLE